MLRQTLIAWLVLTSVFALASPCTFAQAPSDSPRKIVSQTIPIYPPIARTMNIHGIVKLEAVVAANGTVRSVAIKGGHPALAEAAAKAVRAWKWQRASHDTREFIELTFSLSD